MTNLFEQTETVAPAATEPVVSTVTESAPSSVEKPATPSTEAAPVEPAPAEPTDWRKDMAGDDEKLAKLLSRYSTAKDFAKAHHELFKKVSAGELKKPLTKDATPEQVAEWRKANGIPETPDQYALPEGVTFGEEDMPGIKGFLEEVHKTNASPETVTAALGFYHKLQQEAAQARYQADKDARVAAEDTLHAEWGTDYRENLNYVNNFIAANIPAEQAEAFRNARLGDGSPLFSNAAMLKAFAQVARELNPVASTVSGKGMDNAAAIDDRIKELEKKMGSPEWYNSPEREQHRQLLALKERYKA